MSDTYVNQTIAELLKLNYKTTEDYWVDLRNCLSHRSYENFIRIWSLIKLAWENFPIDEVHMMLDYASEHLSQWPQDKARHIHTSELEPYSYKFPPPMLQLMFSWSFTHETAPMQDGAISRMMTSPYASSLVHFEAWSTRWTDRRLNEFVGGLLSPKCSWQNLEGLILKRVQNQECKWDNGNEQWLSRISLPKLKCLDLDNCQIGRAELTDLLENPNIPQLERLVLSQANLYHSYNARHMYSPTLAWELNPNRFQLKRLFLNECGWSSHVGGLFDSDFCNELEVLSVRDWRAGGWHPWEDLFGAVENGRLKHLKVLDCRGNGVTVQRKNGQIMDRMASAIRNQCLPNLELLHIHNPSPALQQACSEQKTRISPRNQA